MGVGILRHGLTPDETFLLESAAIDLLGFGDLANRLHGVHSRDLEHRVDVPRVIDTSQVLEVEGNVPPPGRLDVFRVSAEVASGGNPPMRAPGYRVISAGCPLMLIVKH